MRKQVGIAGLVCGLLFAGLASGADPVVSIIYPGKAKAFAKVFESSAGVFGATPVEVKLGTEKVAHDSSKLTLLITNFQFYNEQRVDAFVRETRYNGLSLASEPIVAGWKNIAVRVDYKFILRDGKQRTKKDKDKEKRFAAAVAMGKAGSSTDIQLDDDFNSLVTKASLKAVDRWHADLLEEVVTYTPIADKFWLAVAQAQVRKSDSIRGPAESAKGPALAPLFYPAKTFTLNQQVVEAEFELENRLPFRVEFDVEYFAVKGNSNYVTILALPGAKGTTSKFSLAPGEKASEKVKRDFASINLTSPILGAFMLLKGRPTYGP